MYPIGIRDRFLVLGQISGVYYLDGKRFGSYTQAMIYLVSQGLTNSEANEYLRLLRKDQNVP